MADELQTRVVRTFYLDAEGYDAIDKDSDDVIDVVFSWATNLSGDSDTISSSTMTVATGLTEDSESNTTTTATVWLSGGTAGSRYKVINRIVTAGGRTKERTIQVHVKE